ncbi:MAG: hypothetical protein H6537_07570 [Bacteroidales bacterium]|nr:hypothetical protein [Bacteroidales bacterium]HPD95592.1 hypothetical protein [Tenuifilaceae bacterium]HRX31724.1 hypothetical protein [Tenuifilaceae bacterium]
MNNNNEIRDSKIREILADGIIEAPEELDDLVYQKVNNVPAVNINNSELTFAAGILPVFISAIALLVSTTTIVAFYTPKAEKLLLEISKLLKFILNPNVIIFIIPVLLLLLADKWMEKVFFRFSKRLKNV